MTALKLIVTIIQLLCGIFLIAIVLLQSGKSAGLSGAIGGNSAGGGFSAKAQSKTLDAKLAKYTKWVALAFVLLTFVLDFI